MLTGRLGNTSGAPYLEAHIFFPRLSVRGLVSFLVDTGADGAIFMPTDSKKLGIRFQSLRTPTVTAGIGGSARCFTEQVVLSFSDSKFVYSYLFPVDLAEPSISNQRIPSLLGRDILNRWRFVLEPSRNLVLFSPRSWDFRRKI